MNITDLFEIKEIILILIILLLVYKLWESECRIDQLEKFQTIEGLKNLSDEAIQSIASVYQKGNMEVTNLKVTGNLDVVGNSTLNGKLDAKSVPSMTVGNLNSSTLNVSSNANIRGKTTLADTTTGQLDVNGGCAIKGKHSGYAGAPLTVMDPSGSGMNTHFFYGGGFDTYIGGGNNVYARTKKYPSGTDQKTILGKGKLLQVGFAKIPLPVVSSFKWA